MDLHNIDTMNKLFAGDKSLNIFADRPPMFDDERIGKYKDAGFNFYIMTEDFVKLFAEGTREINKGYLDALESLKINGVKILIRNHGNYPDYFEGITTELLPYIDGFYMCDEPSYRNIDSEDWEYGSATFDELNQLVEWYNNYGGEKLFHINLLQSYGVEMLHGEISFKEYVDMYVENVLSKVNGPKTISTDYYPLGVENGVNYLKEYYLSDLLTIALKAKEMMDAGEEIYLGFAIQNFADGGLGLRNTVCEADFKFQIYTAMALGAKNLEYYVYAYTDGSSASDEAGGVFVDADCTEYNERYDYIKNANLEAQQLAKALLKFDWVGAQLINGSYNCNAVAKANVSGMELNGFAKAKVLNAYSDVLVSEFKKGDDYAYMLVNYTEPSSNDANLQNNGVSVRFEGATSVIVFQNGEKQIVKLSDGVFTANLGLGETVFVYPLYL